MKWLPQTRTGRWNLLLLIIGVLFAVWLVLVVIGEVFGKNQDVRDDALLIGAVGGFVTLLLGQYRHGQDMDTVQQRLNGVEHDNGQEDEDIKALARRVSALEQREAP